MSLISVKYYRADEMWRLYVKCDFQYIQNRKSKKYLRLVAEQNAVKAFF